ncbi:hypothetical protein C8R43DRAFT_1117793 [Mycena crocata]|nr:hypothetical protein C8R43DRAFT_1117793 [Mycena crocata]
MDPTLRTRLDAVEDGLLGRKLRVAGQVLAYDAYTGLVLLRERDVAVLVDVSNCISAWSREWVGEHLCTVTAVGYLERAPPAVAIPALPKHFPPPRIDEGVVVRALLVAARAELELEMWNEAVLILNNGENKEQ